MPIIGRAAFKQVREAHALIVHYYVVPVYLPGTAAKKIYILKKSRSPIDILKNICYYICNG